MKKPDKKPGLPGNKRGVSIEMAIGFMLIIFALCAVITAITVSLRARDRRVSEMSNDYFMLDQMGDYFVKAVQNMGSSDTLSDEEAREAARDFIEDDAYSTLVDESQVDKFKVQVFYEDVTEGHRTSANADTLAAATRFTMRIWDKEDYEADYNSVLAQSGSESAADSYAMSNNDPLLIVSIDRIYEITDTMRFAQYEIINWSDQENQQSQYLEAKNPVDKKTSGRNFHGLWLFLLLVIVVVVAVVAVIL